MPKLFFFLLCAFPFNVFAWADPIEFENYLANNTTAIHSATSLLNQATQIRNQIQMIENDIKNTGKLSQYQWQNITQLVQHLDAITQQGQALSYAASNLDNQFQQKYPDYTNSYSNPASYSQTAKNWNATTLTLHATLNAMNRSANNFQTEQESMRQLERQGKNLQGRLQALQLLSEISVQQVNQIQALKRLISVQTNAQTAFMAYQASKDSYQEKGLEEMTSAFPTQFPAYKNNPNFGEIPF
ncbi:P-type conjugative transfer protein TrbJ [Rickettsiella grylli]|uniref:P-type conjugative transfer protein TrbJ n=1 Tax=Rickettsiella grylli TaxID=59196 RepID=A8PLK9_9COXI|nr:P-type conjugative transfer protein TrbJ [Rickettsiella grylli]EDP46601.1 P-type conjugative transfer protein TrbJ [Rickettsiella grylli]